MEIKKTLGDYFIFNPLEADVSVQEGKTILVRVRSPLSSMNAVAREIFEEVKFLMKRGDVLRLLAIYPSDKDTKLQVQIITPETLVD